MDIRSAFLEERRKFVGGSDIAAILGISPWRNKVELWLDKTQPRTTEDNNNTLAKRRGSRMEPYILDMIKEDYGLEIVRNNERYIDNEHPFFACEVDFEYRDPETGLIENGEIKTVHPFKKKEWGDEESDQLPLYYLSQVHWGMGINGARKCRVFALIGDELRSYIVERDDELISMLRSEALQFWSFVERGECPSIDYTKGDEAVETLKKLYPGTDGSVIEATAMHEHWRAVMAEAQSLRDHYQNVMAGAKAHILKEMGNAAALQFNDGLAFTRKEIKKKAYTVEFKANTYIDFRLSRIKET